MVPGTFIHAQSCSCLECGVAADMRQEMRRSPPTHRLGDGAGLRGRWRGGPTENQAVAAAQKLTTAQRYHLARPVALDYVKTLAGGDRSAAQARRRQRRLRAAQLAEYAGDVVLADPGQAVARARGAGARCTRPERRGRAHGDDGPARPGPADTVDQARRAGAARAGSACRAGGCWPTSPAARGPRARLRAHADGAAAHPLGPAPLGGVRPGRRPARRRHHPQSGRSVVRMLHSKYGGGRPRGTR